MPFASAQRPAHPPNAAGRGLHFEPLDQRVALDGSGLVGQYFHNVDFTGLAVERVEAVNHLWGANAPAPGINADSFSVRWIGQVEAQYTETYTFRTVSDEGVRLWVDGQLLIDAWDSHFARVDTGSIPLAAGQRYDVRLEYYDSVGSAQITLQWQSPSQPLGVVPAANLYAPAEGLRGHYSDAAGGRADRLDSAIDFAWPGSPVAGVAADDFHATWTGYVRGDHSDQYAFRTFSDDGVRVWVGDKLIIDNWTEHAAAGDIGSIFLEAGKWYDLRVEYFDAAGDAEIRLQWSSVKQTGEGAFMAVPAANLRAGQHAPVYFTNPLGDGADPFVIRWQDSYLHVRSTGGSIWIDKADNLQDIHRSTPESTSVRAWTPPAGRPYSTMVWAPELHQINGKWYIYVAAAANNDNATHRMYVLERDDPNPMGSYALKGQLTPPTDRWAIDGTVLQWNDQLYFIWSGWPGTTDGQQNLYIAPMSNPWTISGERAILSAPTYSWERHGLPINEGPQVLVHDGKLHIIYSASGYWTHQYSLGRLTYKGTGSLLDVNSWTKATAPVFRQSGDVVGTGHASFTESPDGTESWIVYHAHHDKNNWQDNRDILIQPFSWFADGTPNFGAPIPKTTPIEVPSGGADANRPFVAGDFDATGAVTRTDLEVLIAQWGQAVLPGVGADGGADGVVDGADLLLWQRQLGQSSAALAAQAPTVQAAAAVNAAVASPVAAHSLPLPPPTGAAATFAPQGVQSRAASRSRWRLDIPGELARERADAYAHAALGADVVFANWPRAARLAVHAADAPIRDSALHSSAAVELADAALSGPRLRKPLD